MSLNIYLYVVINLVGGWGVRPGQKRAFSGLIYAIQSRWKDVNIF